MSTVTDRNDIYTTPDSAIQHFYSNDAVMSAISSPELFRRKLRDVRAT